MLTHLKTFKTIIVVLHGASGAKLIVNGYLGE